MDLCILSVYTWGDSVNHTNRGVGENAVDSGRFPQNPFAICAKALYNRIENADRFLRKRKELVKNGKNLW